MKQNGINAAVQNIYCLADDVVFFYFLEYIYYLPTTHGAVRCESYKNHNAISDDQDHRPYLRYIMSTMFTKQ